MGSRKTEGATEEKDEGNFWNDYEGIPLWSILAVSLKQAQRGAGGQRLLEEELQENEVRYMAGFKTNAELSPSSTDTGFDHVEIYVQ